MAKLRKMLGKADDAEIVTLMQQIETQSKTTLARWAADWAKNWYLPIAQAADPTDLCLSHLLDTVQACLEGKATQKQLKEQLREGRGLAQRMTEPAAQAAARAIVTACGVLQTPTNALGFCFYGAAAAAYHELGLERSAADYDSRAQVEFERLSQALKQVMVPDEADPVQVDWNC